MEVRDVITKQDQIELEKRRDSLIMTISSLEVELSKVKSELRAIRQSYQNSVEANKLTIIRVAKDVAEEVTGILVSDFESRSRKREIVFPRHISIYLAQRFSNMSLEEVGRETINGYVFDHTTVLNIKRKIHDALSIYEKKGVKTNNGHIVRSAIILFRKRMSALNSKTLNQYIMSYTTNELVGILSSVTFRNECTELSITKGGNTLNYDQSTSPSAASVFDSLASGIPGDATEIVITVPEEEDSAYNLTVEYLLSGSNWIGTAVSGSGDRKKILLPPH